MTLASVAAASIVLWNEKAPVNGKVNGFPWIGATFADIGGAAVGVAISAGLTPTASVIVGFNFAAGAQLVVMLFRLLTIIYSTSRREFCQTRTFEQI